MFVLLYIVGYIFALIELMRAEVMYMRKWGRGYDIWVVTHTEFYMMVALLSWVAYVPALLLRLHWEEKYGKNN